jgi:cytidyltransferase-like protein
MIVCFDQLKRHRGEVAMVDGCFDPLHRGHVEYFRAASELGLPLLCNVTGDDYLVGKHAPLLPADQRATIIDAIRHIAYTHVSRVSTAEVLRELRPRYYVKGDDWRNRIPPEQAEVAREHNIEIVYLPTVYDSSTSILQRFVAATERSMTPADAVSRFEAHVFGQLGTPAAEYDDAYFTDEWREGGNSYKLETRRQIEGRHPQLIKEVFQPARVLDVGCGPGALMYLLYEQGVLADGLDVSPQSKQLAPPEVRDRIFIGSATAPLFPDESYDLVICRELIEHLTVLEARRLVQNMCRISSRLVYVTTRFHPSPATILDITDERHVDPTHITVMTKELLRVMFILEGFKSRPDLEQRIDWLNKGRVLVYEKQKAEGGGRKAEQLRSSSTRNSRNHKPETGN